MPAAFPIQEAFLIGAVVQAALWGIYSTVFAGHLWLLFGKKNRNRASFSYVHIAAIVLYILCTAHFALVFRRLFEAFFLYASVVSPIDYYAQEEHVRVGPNAAKEFIYSIVSVLGDSIIVWRCHVLWGRKYFYITAVPAILIVLTLVGGFTAEAVQLKPSPNPDLITSFGSMLFFCSFLTNVIATILLAGRIWWLSSAAKMRHYHPILLLILESGGLLSAAKCTEFVLYELADPSPVTGTNAVYILYDSMPQLVGLVPTMILILVNLGATTAQTTMSVPDSSPMVFNARRDLRSSRAVMGTIDSANTSIPLEPLNDATKMLDIIGNQTQSSLHQGGKMSDCSAHHSQV